VKALSDVICTSGNAVRIVERVPADREILFVPDQNLGQWVAENRPAAHAPLAGQLLRPRALHRAGPREGAEVPRRRPSSPTPSAPQAVRDMADEVCSTELMVEVRKTTPATRIIVVTESGMLHRLRREVPDKTFIAGPTDTCACNDCRFMKMNTIEKVRDALLNMRPAIEMPEAMRHPDPAADWSRA
jgi:quinolinate synthase